MPYEKKTDGKWDRVRDWSGKPTARYERGLVA